MPIKSENLHGNAPDTSEIALLLIDVINDLEFEDADKLFEPALSAAQKIAALKQRVKRIGIPVIYVNDNYGKWQSDFNKLVRHCLDDDVRGKPIAELLQPDEDDYFVLKPKNSGFFSTTLETLLKYLKAEKLILTGFAGDNCVLFTANDAYMREYHLIIPSDCTASIDPQNNELVLKLMKRTLKADTKPSEELEFNGSGWKEK